MTLPCARTRHVASFAASILVIFSQGCGQAADGGTAASGDSADAAGNGSIAPASQAAGAQARSTGAKPSGSAGAIGPAKAMGNSASAGRAGTAGMSGTATAPGTSAAAAASGAPTLAGAAGAAGALGAASAQGRAAAGSGGSETARVLEPLDCGKDGIVIENAGPPKNRVNYAIIGDGYTMEQLPKFKEHIDFAMKKRFSPVIGQPYGRYRKFVNICGVQLVSQSGPIGSGPTALSCSGDDQSRLANCDTKKVNQELAARLPASFEVDWKAVVLNNDRWWNTGAVIMLWSGAHKDAAGAALHEGGHGFHQLADEYDGTNGGCDQEYDEVNSTHDQMMTAGKWDLWLGYDQADATGMQTTIAGSRYCKTGQFRPSMNSMMNQLFGDKPNTSYNSVSREKMVMDVWRAVTPIDEVKPPEGAVANPTTLEVVVIDPEVINVDWSVDEQVVAANGGTSFDVAAHALPSGSHTITARAYDNAGPELVRYVTGTKYGRMNWARSQQTVKWTVQVP